MSERRWSPWPSEQRSRCGLCGGPRFLVGGEWFHRHLSRSKGYYFNKMCQRRVKAVTRIARIMSRRPKPEGRG